MIRFANLIYYVIHKSVTLREFSRHEEDILYYSNCVKAIPLHYMDNKAADVTQRRHFYHSLCQKDFCNFLKLTPEEQLNFVPPSDGCLYFKEYDKKGKTVTNIMDQIIAKFNEIGSVENMSKCTRLLNTNVNESIHHRTIGIVSKALSYSVEHVEFAAELSRCIHNYGYEKTFGTW